MKKHVYMILLLLVFIVFPKYIYADCTNEEMTHFREIRSEFKVSYMLDEEKKQFYMTLFNPEPENFGYIVKYDTGDNDTESLDLTSTTEVSLGMPTLTEGKYKITIKGKTATCDRELKNIRITIPKYNMYSEDPLCEGIEEFVLCQKAYNRELEYEKFVSRVNNYKIQKANSEKEQLPEEKENKILLILKAVLNYIRENLITIIIVITFIILLVISLILMIKNIRKSRRLE